MGLAPTSAPDRPLTDPRSPTPRIGWFTPRSVPAIGGAESYALEMCRRWIQKGWDAEIVTSDAWDLWYFASPLRRKVPVDAPGCSDGVRIRRFPVAHPPGRRYWSRLLAQSPAWSHQCRFAPYMPYLPTLHAYQNSYDLVFAAGFPFTVFAHAAWRVARASGAPLVIVPFLHLGAPGDAVSRHLHKPHQIRLLRAADAVVVQTKIEADAVIDWGISPDRIMILGAGYDPPSVTGGDRAKFRREHHLDDRDVVIGHLTTLDPDKGSVDLIDAVHRLQCRGASEFPHAKNLCLVAAGAASPRFEAFLERENVRDRPGLRILPPLGDGERRDFFAAIDVFALPSRTDSYGIVLLESWANGCPVVGADAGGLPEVIRHQKDGLLVPFGDPQALAEALGVLADDPKLRAAYGAAGREKVEYGYTWDDRFRQLWERISPMHEARVGPRR